MTQEDVTRPPARIPWPPILVIATLVAGGAIDRALGLPVVLPQGAGFVGGVLVALALINDVWCALLMRRHRTTIMPHRPVSNLVTEGPFRFSRNPIYVSHMLLTLGLGLFHLSLATIVLLPLLFVGLVKLAIEPEERHLRLKFPGEFAAYAAHTRRWF